MKNLTNQFIAGLLLLCFSVTIVPLNFLHEHSHEHLSEETHCELNDKIHTDDACHFTIFHNTITENHCSHKSHFTANELECDFCKNSTSQREVYTVLQNSDKLIQQYHSILIALQLEQHQQSFTGLIFNKGSPFLG